MVTVTHRLERFIKFLLCPINLMVSEPIPAVYCMQLPHTITCSFSKSFKYCTFLPRFSNIFPFFNISLPFFWKTTAHTLSRIGPGCNIEKVLSLINLMVYLLESMDFWLGCRAKSIFLTQHWCSESKVIAVLWDWQWWR